MSEQQRRLFDSDSLEASSAEAAGMPVATVVFPEPPHGPFEYRVPPPLKGQVEAGRRLRLPLGRGNRSVVGYCVAVADGSQTGRSLKDVKSVVDGLPILSPAMLQLTQWIAEHYLCHWGQVLETVVPASVRGQAGTREVTFLHVATNVATRLTQLKLPEKQSLALKRLAQSPHPLTVQQLAMATGSTTGPIKALREKGLVRAETRRVHQNEHEQVSIARELPLRLNEPQQLALDEILAAVNAGRQQTVVVHGVTGSGKTEVYIQAIEKVVRDGRQAIVLVPEISLTPQTLHRFRCRFDHVAVMHSHLSAAERHWHWRRIAQSEVQVVVGARSAIFAPTVNLGLIVIDEEHDASFKQDKTPRYHAREVALRRAEMEQIPLVLGSATPSLETWHRASQGVYRKVELPHRVSDRPLPHVSTIDLRAESRDRTSRGAISRPLHQAIDRAVKAGGQVILLLNRRGYSTHIQCPACGKVVSCPHCDIALTHHREGEKAVCHYCDYQIEAPSFCPDCRFDAIRYAGLGTQRLEAELHARFRGVPCLRMDSDTMQRVGSHEQALDRFRRGEVKILLGTQMIAKGLDFPNVTLVGVINADTALHLPDFRAAERTFQLVTQVAGRTGRGEKGGEVLVQTYSPEHPAIESALNHDYHRFAAEELPSRREFGYPPFSNLIRLIVRGPRETTTEEFARHMGTRLQTELRQQHVDGRILGPAAAPFAKLRGRFRFHLQLQSPDKEGLRRVARAAAEDLSPPSEVQWTFDVDPLDML